jgi:hypothetical protein
MSSYAPCPKCQNNQASPVSFTWWGGLVGPKLLTHVKCLRCGAKYNGKTGNSNTMGITIYSIVLLIIVILVSYLIGK